jgi:hypothetical protein
MIRDIIFFLQWGRSEEVFDIFLKRGGAFKKKKTIYFSFTVPSSMAFSGQTSWQQKHRMHFESSTRAIFSSTAIAILGGLSNRF